MGRGRVRALLEKTDSLFAETLKGGYDDTQPWNAIHTLRKTGRRVVFERAAMWCSSPSPLKRARGADILAQLGRYNRGRRRYVPPEWPFRAESFNLITQVIEGEQNAFALGSQISALGHFDNVAAVPFIAAYADHPDENVRFQVSFALGCYPNDPTSIRVLQDLMEDTDRDVRDWAIFGLGLQGNADSEEIRAKFFNHLDDPFLDARIEAAAALGKRRDARLAKPLVQMLRKDGALRGITEAARELLELEEDPKDWV
jgi:hypothetical protein